MELLPAKTVHRIITSPVLGDSIPIPQEDVHHLTRVLRLREGDEIEALSPDGFRYRCVLAREGRVWIGRIKGVSATPWESPFRITLAQALAKGDKFDWVVQKAVELGVEEILPLVSARTEVSLDEKRRGRRLGRWRRIAEEATKQCGRIQVPRIAEPAGLQVILEGVRGIPLLALDEAGGQTLTKWLSRASSLTNCLVFVGPEGGWDDSDRKLFEGFRVSRVRLGPRILRTETAAVAILSLLQFARGDLASDPGCFDIDYRRPGH